MSRLGILPEAGIFLPAEAEDGESQRRGPEKQRRAGFHKVHDATMVVPDSGAAQRSNFP